MITSPTNVKKLALAIAGDTRPAAKFSRVSKEFINAVEANTRAFIADRVGRHPSIGTTLK